MAAFAILWYVRCRFRIRRAIWVFGLFIENTSWCLCFSSIILPFSLLNCLSNASIGRSLRRYLRAIFINSRWSFLHLDELSKAKAARSILRHLSSRVCLCQWFVWLYSVTLGRGCSGVRKDLVYHWLLALLVLAIELLECICDCSHLWLAWTYTLKKSVVDGGPRTLV